MFEKWRRWTYQQKKILVSILIQQLFTYMCLSNMAPFFPLEASLKGVGESTVGFVFAANALTTTVLSPIVGRCVIPVLGRKFVLLSGSWLAGGSAVLFGLLGEIRSPDVFIAMCFVVRIAEAVGVSMYITAGFSFLAQTFKKDLGFVMGLSEMSVGFGFLFGPTLGGFLYETGGFKLPFLTLGSMLLSTIPVSMTFVPNDRGVERTCESEETHLESERSAYSARSSPPPFEDGGISQLGIGESTEQLLSDYDDRFAGAASSKHPVSESSRKSWSCVFFFFVCYITINAVTISFFETTLELHLRPLGMEPSQVGYFFVISSICYLSFGLVAGTLADKFKRQRLKITAFGMVAQCAAYIIVGPCPFLGIGNYIWLNAIALALMGFSFASALIPTFAILFDVYEQMARNSRPISSHSEGDGDVVMYSTVSGIWQSSYSFGEFLGPALGGILIENQGYPVASSIMAILCLISAILVSILDFSGQAQRRKHSIVSSAGVSTDSGIDKDSLRTRQRSKTESSERCPLLVKSTGDGLSERVARHNEHLDERAYGRYLRGTGYSTMSL